MLATGSKRSSTPASLAGTGRIQPPARAADVTPDVLRSAQNYGYGGCRSGGPFCVPAGAAPGHTHSVMPGGRRRSCCADRGGVARTGWSAPHEERSGPSCPPGQRSGGSGRSVRSGAYHARRVAPRRSVGCHKPRRPVELRGGQLADLGLPARGCPRTARRGGLVPFRRPPGRTAPVRTSPRNRSMPTNGSPCRLVLSQRIISLCSPARRRVGRC